MSSTFSPTESGLSIILLLILIPTLLWLHLMDKKGDNDRRDVSKSLLMGMSLSVPVIMIQFAWLSQSDIEVYLHFENPRLIILITTIIAGMLMAMAKFAALIFLQRWNVKIKTVNQTIRLMVAAAIGFAFIENLIYFIKLSDGNELGNLYQNFVWHSLLVTTGHMLFSGILAYYYAIGKMGDPIVAMDLSMGKKHPIVRFLKKVFNIRLSKSFEAGQIAIGLLLAALFHASFNGILQSNHMKWGLVMVIVAFIFLKYLGQKRISYLIFTPSEVIQNSEISEKEQRVVISLIGTWNQKKKYQQIISLCNRLLIKHPGNRLLGVIKARAKDRKRIEYVKAIFRDLLLFKRPDDYCPPEKYTNTDTRTIHKKNHPKKKISLGLVLGGGAIRACLHLGFYQVLQENGIEVDYITGTSGGAMIGAPLALGQDTELIKSKILAQRDLKFTLENFKYFDESIIEHDFLKTGVQLLCEGKSFYDLKIPFACVAVDLECGQEVIFKDGALEPAVAASASMPMIFPPVYYRNKFLIDGGIRNNLPCVACRELGADKIIAISINSYRVQQCIAGDVFAKYHEMRSELKRKMRGGPIKRLLARKRHDLAHFINIITQVISISSECCNREELERGKPDLHINVQCNMDLFEFNKTDEIIEMGRKAALENLDKIKALLKEE